MENLLIFSWIGTDQCTATEDVQKTIVGYLIWGTGILVMIFAARFIFSQKNKLKQDNPAVAIIKVLAYIFAALVVATTIPALLAVYISPWCT